MDSSVDSGMDLNDSECKAKTYNNKKSVKQNMPFYPCEIVGCDYTATKRYNLNRHVEETHLKHKKKCICGKQFTASSLSRHKQECSMSQPDKLKSQINADIVGINDNEIVNVEKHQLEIKVVTKKDGSVVFVYKNFRYAGTDYVLTPMENLNGERIHITKGY